MMTKKKSKVETGAIEDVVAQISHDADARTIAQLALSEFGDKYNPELPDEMGKLVGKTLSILKKIHEKGYDMKQYCIQMRDTVAAGYSAYDGKNYDEIRNYTLKVADEIIYKSKIIQNKPGTKLTRKLPSNFKG